MTNRLPVFNCGEYCNYLIEYQLFVVMQILAEKRQNGSFY